MNTILEALKELKNINEEVDTNLYANYVNTLPIFIDVLKNKRILTNYIQWKGGKDFDTRGNHICLTNDLINPPRIMPGCQFGIALDKDKLDILVKEKAKTGLVRSVGSFITDDPKKDNYIDTHEDSRYRRYMNKILNKVKNKSMGMAVVAIYETKSGDKFISFYQWTWRDILISKDPEILKWSNDLFDDLKEAFERLYSSQNHDINGFDSKKTCVRLGDSKLNEYDLEIEKKYFPNLYTNNPSFASGYCIGLINELGSKSTTKLSFSSVPIRIESDFDHENHREHSVINIKNVAQIPVSENEMFALDAGILDEHEFRLYTAEVKKEEHKKATVDSKTDFEKIPNAFFYFENSDIVKRIFIPNIYQVNKSNKVKTISSDLIQINFYALFMDIANNSVKSFRNEEELKNILYLKGAEGENNKHNLSQHAYSDANLEQIKSFGIDLNDMYRLFIYTNIGSIRKNLFNTKTKRVENIIECIRCLKQTMKEISYLQEILKNDYGIKDWNNDLYWYQLNREGDSSSKRLGKISSTYMFKKELN